jgi:glucose-1-phosphate adenylyltransferase
MINLKTRLKENGDFQMPHFQIVSKKKAHMYSISKSVVAVILGGGAGSRLYPLTSSRSKPAVPIAGKYRLVDIPISNCINSNINRMFVLTQFNSASLNKHIKNTYHFSAFSTGFVDILAAEQTPDNPGWFQGTADAVRQSLRHISNMEFEYILNLKRRPVVPNGF